MCIRDSARGVDAILQHAGQVRQHQSVLLRMQNGFRLQAIHDFLRDAPKVDVHIVTQEPK